MTNTLKCPTTECDEDAAEPHECPFASEIQNDDEFTCTCCDECTHQCAMDI